MKNIPPFKLKISVLSMAAILPLAPPSVAAEETDCAGNARVWGRVIGVGLGAFIGHKVGDSKVGATVVGAVLGGFIGDFIGNEIDRRNCELDKIARANGIDINHDETELTAEPPQAEDMDTTFAENTGLVESSDSVANASKEDVSSHGNDQPGTVKVDVTTWKGEQHFEVGSAKLTPKAREYFAQAARQYSVDTVADAAVRQLETEAELKKQTVSSKDKQTVKEEISKSLGQRPIVLVGHTDDAGDSKYNQLLSEKRARAVAEVFKQNGIPAERLYYRGAGETDPIASNMTDEGRAQNRRVEVIELESKDKLLTFAALKKPKYEYYRPQQGEDYAASIENNSSNSVSKGVGTVDKIAAPGLTTSTKSPGETSKPMASNASDSRTDKISDDPHQTGKADAISDVTPKPAKTAKVETDSPRTSAKTTTGFDLEGIPADNTIDTSIKSALGKPGAPSQGLKDTLGGLSNLFISTAQASDDTVYSVPCTLDRARYAGDYKSLATGKPLQQHKTADYAPGLYNTAWAATIGNNYAGIAPIAVLRGNYEPVSSPSIYLYANTTSQGRNATWKDNTQVAVYPAEKGLLYRVFSKGKSDFVCADIVMPHRAPFQSPAGKLYYRQGGSLYAVTFTPAMLVTK